MHVPRDLHPIERTLAERLPHLRPPQRRGLALWVLGAVLAQSACQSAVLAALLVHGRYHALRQRLRDWLLDGTDKACPCAAQVEADGPPRRSPSRAAAPPPRRRAGSRPRRPS